MQAKIRHIVLTILVMGGAIFAVLPGVASADSIGQCNRFPGNEMHSVNQWLNTLQAEGVLGQAGSKVFSGAGFNSVDGQSTKKWAEQRVVLVHTQNSYTGMDFSCREGVLSPWKVTTNPVGTPTFVTLPSQFNKHNSSTHRTKKFSRRIRVHGHVVGFAPCANTHEGEASFFLFVAPAPKHHKVKPKPKPTVVQVNKESCNGQLVAIGSCVNQANVAEQKCEGGKSSGSGATFTCTIIQINANCSNVTVYNGEHIVVNSYQEGNCNVTIEEKHEEVKKEEKPPPPPPPCELTNLRKLEAKDTGEATKEGATTPISVELVCQPGDNVLITFHAEFGHFEQSTMDVTGPGKYKETLVVPANGMESDTYWVSGVDLTTGQKVKETEHWTYAIEKESTFF